MHPGTSFDDRCGSDQPTKLLDRLRGDVDIGSHQRRKVFIDAVEPCEHRAAVSSFAELQGLRGRRYAKPLGAGRAGLPSAFEHPMAVTIRLDHNHHWDIGVPPEGGHIRSKGG